MSDQLVTLVTYTYATESYVLVAKLEAEGIYCFVKNEHLISTQQFLSNAVGGLDVQVKEKDLEKAKAVLKALQDQNNIAVPEQLAKGWEKLLTYCPKCESTNVYRKKGSLFSFGAKEHTCADCRHSWKQ